ncbi:hypothetical protein Tsubulata_001444 [Turnera subulata]|uniref:Uncharacterized protein n=1 Tax=Turnera subulata TaxID=218843 RepID=A0A9Q0FFQ1_9ROSI|nr:hypothetical protein Tsubulata_001444 [Turnera subulata]
MATTPAFAAGNGGPQCKSTYRGDEGSRERLRVCFFLYLRLTCFRKFRPFVLLEKTNISLISVCYLVRHLQESLLFLFCQILVIFMGTDEINVASIHSIFGQLVNGTNLDGLIMVLQSKMNNFARKELDKFPCKVEVFEVELLCFFMYKVAKNFLSG